MYLNISDYTILSFLKYLTESEARSPPPSALQGYVVVCVLLRQYRRHRNTYRYSATTGARRSSHTSIPESSHHQFHLLVRVCLPSDDDILGYWMVVSSDDVPRNRVCVSSFMRSKLRNFCYKLARSN